MKLRNAKQYLENVAAKFGARINFPFSSGVNDPEVVVVLVQVDHPSGKSFEAMMDLKFVVGQPYDAEIMLPQYRGRWRYRTKHYPVTDFPAVLKRRYRAWERRAGLRPSANRLENVKICREAREKGHRNACAVTALSRAVGCSFEDADAFWKLYGGRTHDHQGTFTRQALLLADPEGGSRGRHPGCFKLDLLDVHLVPIYFKGTVHRLMKSPHADGRLFVLISRHAFAVVDGEIFDSGHTSGLCRVQDAWRVCPLSKDD
jgi:hypothetical protein